MVALASLKDTTKSADLFDALKMTMKRFSLSMKNLSAIITDGAPAMIGKNEGLVKMIKNEAIVAGNTVLMAYHCIVHQGNLCGKVLKMENVLGVVIKTINFIRAKGLNHRQFQEFLKAMGTEFADVIYYTEVRWLSKGKMLKRFYDLRTEIKIFMETKGKPVAEFEDEDWILDLAFLVDVTEHLNDLNLRLQGRNQLINNMFQTITAFERKLKLWHSQIIVKDLTHFSTLAGHKVVSCSKYAKYAGLIFDLIQEFESRFQDFRKNEEYFNIFSTPFSLEINKLPSNLQMECIELQSDIQLKEKFGNVSLLEFYKDCLPRDKYPNFHNHALLMCSAFGSTYICEQLFSRMKQAKNKNRTKITDRHLENALRIATSSIEPDIDLLVQQKQIHPSH